MPNYKYVPIGYHGRARPSSPPAATFAGPKRPAEAPRTRRSDLRGEPQSRLRARARGLDRAGNALGTDRYRTAADHIRGFCLLNDWSRADVQGWEYQPLGPFLGKSFSTTVSPWVITPEALAPFRMAQASRPAGDPARCPICSMPRTRRQARSTRARSIPAHPGLAAKGLPAHRLSASNTRDLYWTIAQLVAHHSSNAAFLATATPAGEYGRHDQ